MILTKFDPPVKILRVKSGLWKFEGSKSHFRGQTDTLITVGVLIVDGQKNINDTSLLSLLMTALIPGDFFCDLSGTENNKQIQIKVPKCPIQAQNTVLRLRNGV
jgi:hypothetical protein